MSNIATITPDHWQLLRHTTPARLALGRAGGSVPTYAWLEFKSAHAAARDAVHHKFDAGQLAGEIGALGWPVEIVDTAALDRHTYLLRPDLGRRLDERSRFKLQQLQTVAENDLAIIVSDGLSALAVHRQSC